MLNMALYKILKTFYQLSLPKDNVIRGEVNRLHRSFMKCYLINKKLGRLLYIIILFNILTLVLHIFVLNLILKLMSLILRIHRHTLLWFRIRAMETLISIHHITAL